MWSKFLFANFRKKTPIEYKHLKKVRLLVEALEKRELLSTLAQWSFTQTVAAPDNSPAATTDNTGGTALLATIGMGTGSNGFAGHTTDVASDDLLSTPGTAGVAISNATESGITVTITTSAANTFTAGEQVTIAKITPSGYNGLFTIGSILNSTQFTYTAASGLISPATGFSGATVTLTEQTLRVRGAPNNGWATHAAGAPQYSQGIEMDISTAGYANIQFSFDWYSTTQGIRDLQFQYNTNTSNSAGWTNFGGTSPTGTYIATPNDFYNAPGSPSINVNLSSIAGANNDPTFGVRLVAAFDSTGNLPNEFASAALSGGSTVIYNNTSGNWRFDNLTFTGSQGSSAPAITSANSTSVYAGQAGTFQVNTTGSPAPIYSLTGAPSWVTINSSGLLSFATSRPTISSSTPYTFTINASNGVAPNAQQSFTVTDTVAAPSFTSGSSASVYAGLSGTFQVTTVAGPATTGYSLAGAPSWVSINNSGLMTFTNPASVTTTTPLTFTLKATNSVGTTPENFTITELPTVVYSTQNTPYNQTFTTLPTTDVTPVSGTGTPVGGPYDLTGASPNGFGASGLTGWYGGNLVSGAEKFGVGEGGATTGALMAFHNSGSSTNMALGTISTTSTASRFGVVLVNNTGLTLNNFSLSYIGEEWREGTAAGPQTLNFSYAIGSANILSGNFVPVAALGFISPHDGDANAGTALDGSLSQNQVPVSGTLNGFSWGAGQAMEIVWDKGTGAGQSDGLGIQNLTFSAQHVNQFPPTITTAGRANVFNGQTSSFQVGFTGFPAPTFSLSVNPGWASISNGGLLTFTSPPNVTTPTQYTFTINATNGVSPDASQTFTVVNTGTAPVPFTPGNLVLLEVNNDGNSSQYTSEGPVTLVEYQTNNSAAGTTAVQIVPVANNEAPNVGTGNQPLTLDTGTTNNKNGNGVGILTRSFDSSVLTFAGNDDNVNGSGFSSANRVIAQVGVNPANGINTTTYGPLSTGDDIRSVVEANSGALYTAGHTPNGGLRDISGLGNSPTTGNEVDTATTKNNVRAATVAFNGELSYSSAKSTIPGIFVSYNSADTSPVFLPTSSGTDQQIIQDPNTTGNPNGMYVADMNGDGILDNGDQLFFVDATAGLFSSTYNGTTWGTPVLAFNPGVTGQNLLDLAGQVNVATGDVKLYYTSSDGTGNSYVFFTDTLSNTNTTLISNSSPDNGLSIPGVAFAPVNPSTISQSITPNPTNPAINVTFKATVSSPNAVGGNYPGVVYFIDSNTNTVLNPGGSPINTSGVATFQTTGLNAGQYNVHAYYAGTAAIAAATSASTPLSITGTHASSTTLASTPNSSTVGGTVTLTATVAGTAGNPTGSVTFFDNGNLLGSGNVSTSGGVTTATFTTAALSAGTHTLTAFYAGDNTYLTSSNANTDHQVVNAGATITISDGSANGYGTATAGSTVTFTATVTGNGVSGLPNGSPAGTVQFFEDGSATPFATANLTGSGNTLTATGSTTIGLAGLQINDINGSHLITATYVPAGSSQYVAVTTSPPWIETAKQNFGIGNLIVLDRPNQANNASQIVSVLEYTTAGQLVQTVTLPDISAGTTNTFGLSGHASTEGALGVSGNQSLLSSFGFDLPVGTVSATSTSAATNPRTVVSINNAGVIDSSTTVEVPTNDALLNPRGAVTNDGKEFWVVGDGSNTNTGIQYATDGTLNNPPTANGTNALEGYEAEILGGNLYVSTGATGGSNGVFPVIVEFAGLPTASAVGTPLPGLGAAYAGQGFTKPAPYGFLLFNHLTGTAVNPDTLYIADQSYGLLKFYFDGTNWQYLSEKLNNNTSVEGLVGFETLHDPFNGGNPSFTLYATAALSNGNPSNQLLSFTDDAAYNQPNIGGLFNVIANAVNPTDTFSGLAFAPLNTTTTTLTSSANPASLNQSITITATITDTTGTFSPTGTVTFTVDGVAQTPTTLSGSGTSVTATLTFANPFLTGGTHTITASYSGDTNNGTSSSTLTETVSKAQTITTVASSITNASYGSNDTLTATVTSPLDTPNGTVTFMDGTTVLGTNSITTVSGKQEAIFTTTSPLGVGNHTMSAVYNPGGSSLPLDATSTGTATVAITYNPGTLVVTLVGTGSTLTSSGAATFLQNYQNDGTPLPANQIPLPTASGAALTEGGTTTTEGYLTDAADGHSLSIAGYQATPGSSTSSALREVGVVGPSGGLDISTQMPSTTGSVRVAVSADGLGFWVATSTGIRYVPFGNSATTASTQITAEVASPTAVGVFADGTTTGQLFGSAGAGALASGVPALDSPYSVGTGLPTNGGQSIAVSPSFPTARDAFNNFPSTNQFAISPDGNTIYIADSRTDSNGGILKYYQSSPNNWTLVDHYQIDSFSIASASETGTSVTITTNGNHDFTVGESVTIAGVSVTAYNTATATITSVTGNTFTYTISSQNLASGSGGFATSNDGGVRAVVADFSGANPVLYVTTTATSANRIVKLVDNGDLIGDSGGFTATVLATAPANEAFRGVALAPTNPGITTSSTSLLVTNSPGNYGTGVTLTATVTNGATGWVSFRQAGIEIGAAPIVGNTATLNTAGNLGAATFNVVAVYTGDATYAASTSALQSVTISKATTSTTLTASASPVATGVTVTLTATLTAPVGTSPTGTITFKNGTTTIGTPVTVSQTVVSQSGNPVIVVTATTTTSFSSLGTQNLSAIYSGDNNFATSTGTVPVLVVASTTTTVTTSNANPTATPSSTVTLTATVNGTGGTPSGSVQFYDDLLPIGSPATLNSSGAGTMTVTTALLQAANALTPGLHSISAIYLPDSNSINSFFTSTGVYEQAVQAKPFGAGDQFVLRVGDGTTNLVAQKPNPIAGSGSIGSTIYVDEYTPSGTLVQSIALPSADGTGSQNTIHAVVGNGQQSATEQMTLSGDGQYLFVTGYDNNPLNAGTAVAVPTASGNNAVPRAIARIKYDGTIQTEAFTAGSSGVQTSGNLNGVYSPDGNQFYISGANGVTYFSSFTPSASLVSATATISSNIGATATGLENYNGNLAAVSVPYTGAFLVGAFTGFPKANTNAVAISTLTESTSGAGTTVTVTTMAANGFATGAAVKIAGAVPAGYNGTFTVTVTSPTTFTYTAATAGLANSTTGGTATEVLTLPGLPSTDTFQQFPIDVYFAHLNGSGAPAGVNTMYISDDGPSFANGAITKWALSPGGTWSLVDTVTAGTGNTATTFYWLSGATDAGGNVTLFSTYGNGGNSVTGPGFLYSIVDQNGWNAPIGTGGAHSDTVTAAATVPTGSNEVFRGVAGAPIAAVTSITDNGPNPSPLGTSVSFTVTVTGGQIGTGGTVTLEDAAHSNQVVGTGTLVNGAVTIATTSLVQGTDQIFAVYGTNQSNQVTHTVSGGAFSKYVVTVLGGSSFVAGNSFLFTVQATDSAGNAVTSYTGPSTVTISANPTDPLSNFPLASGSLNASGFGFFLGNLKTVGSYNLTASGTISGNTFTGTSSTVAVTPATAIYFNVTAPASATTGLPVNVTVAAFDLYKNVATGYTGAVKLTSTSAGTLGSVYTFTTTEANPDNGVHTFSVTLNSGGTQTITATDTAASTPNIAGTSNPITTRGLVVTSVTPTPTGFSATFNKAFVPGDVYLYNANLTTTADVVMTATSDRVSFITPSGTVKFIYNGRPASPTATFAYSPATTAPAFQAYLQTIQGLTAAGAVVVAGPNGGPFTVNFGPGVTGGALLADLSGFASVLNAGKISGTLLIDPSNSSIIFKATSSNLQQKNQQVNPNDPPYSSVVLPDATYTIKLVTGTGSGASANGFFDTLGVGLDGANNGGVSSFTTTFTTSFQANATPVLGIPDFARGPDSNTPITVPNQLAFGIPVTLYNAAHVTDVTFSLTYNASLLNVTGTRSGSNSDATDKSGANLVLVSAVGGVATFHYTDTAPISATPDAPLVLGDITAVVPSNSGAADLSLYQVKEQLQPGNIVINSGGVTGAVGSNGIHVNAYAGDVNGDKMIDGLDKLAANFIATNTAPAGVGVGFSAYTQLDPVIIGDIAGDLSVDAGDVTTIDSFVAQLNPLQIPQPPTQLPKTNPNFLDPTTMHSPNAADPTLSLVSSEGLVVKGSNNSPLTNNLSLSVMIDHPDPEGSTGLTSATLALTYDPTMLSLSSGDITLGSIPSQGNGWQLTSVIDQATGQIGIQLYSSTPITSSQAGSLVNISFHPTSGAQRGASSPITPTVKLVSSVTPNGQWFGTNLADAQGGLILSQGVTQLLLPSNLGYDSNRDFSAQTSNDRPETGAPAQITLESHEAIPAISLDDATQTPEANEKPALAAFSNGAFAGETAHPLPASLVVSGLLAFQTNGVPITAAPLAGQVVQIANAPLTSLPAIANPPQDSVDRWILALASAADGQGDANGSDQQSEANTAVVDRVFAEMADDMSDLGDF